MVERYRSARPEQQVVLFEPLQVASLAKAALLFLPSSSELRPTTQYGHLATALLRMTDLLGPGDLGDMSTEQGRIDWNSYLFATGIFYRGGSTLHDLARFRELCMAPHTELAGHPDYLPLPDLLSSATGLDGDTLWLGLTALQAQWLAQDARTVAAGCVFLNENEFLTAGFQIPLEVQSKILAVAAANGEALQAAVRSRFSAADFRPYDLLPLADKPLVRLGGRVFCPSLPLLVSKMGPGLYYLLANSLAGPQRDRFTRFMGAVFEEYVGRLIKRLFESPGFLILGGDAIRTAVGTTSSTGQKFADFIVFKDGVAVVIECKARFFDHASRTGGDGSRLSSRLQDIYSRGSLQLESTIELAESGVFKGVGLNPEELGAYVPLLVSLDETPLLPPVYDAIAPIQPKRGEDKTVPLQVVGVSELEAFEGACAAGRLNLHALLGYKGSTGSHAGSLRGFVHSDSTLRSLSGLSPHLRSIYDEAMTHALLTLKERMR
jgi:hypothetical protein